MTTKHSNESPKLPTPGLCVGNLGDPIYLNDVRIDGISGSAAQPGDQVQIITEMSANSDDPSFHRIVENLSRNIEYYAREAGQAVDISRYSTILLIIKPNNSAELWADTAAMSITGIARKPVQAGTVIFEGDVVDALKVQFPLVNINMDDKIFFLIRHNWRFAFYFNFNPEKNIKLDYIEIAFAKAYREIAYKNIYDFVVQTSKLDALISAGWFPFIEIISHEFRDLASHLESGLSLGHIEGQILRKFDHARLDRMLERWLANPNCEAKADFLRTAISAFKREEPISVIKIILTEIEGILSEIHARATGKRARGKDLIDFIVQAVEKKFGATNSVLMPIVFVRYLKDHTFKPFDPLLADGTAGSRHAVGHGAAGQHTYTMVCALQALLTLDQIVAST